MAAEEGVTDRLEQGDIIPGLSNLNLNILHGNDMYMIDDTMTDILHSQEYEHPIVQTIDTVFLALLTTKLPRKQHESRQYLENVLDEHPNHLNALVELEKIYRSTYRISDADNIRAKCETICKSSTEEFVSDKVTCLLEQGFVLRIERTLINENSLLQQMDNLHCIIKNEYERNDKSKKEFLGTSLNHFTRSKIDVEKAFAFISTDGHYQRIKRSLLKYEHALRLCPLQDLHPAWRFQYAKTVNQFYNSLDDLVKRGNQQYKQEMVDVTVQAVLIFWDITQQVSFDECVDMRRYIAQSYAYLGHIIFSRSKIITEVLVRLTTESTVNTFDFKGYIQNPIQFNKISYDLFPNDVVVLSRFGRSYWLLSKSEKDISKKRAYLKQALGCLTKSKEIDDAGNRFSISCQMVVNLDLAKFAENTALSKKFFTAAKRDGEDCCNCMPTRRDMNVLAEICQMLAKFPKFRRYGNKNVKSIGYLHEALEFLQYGDTLGEPIDNFFTYRMASCLFDLDELEQAVEWQQRTWFLSSRGSNNFILMCYFISKLIETKGNDSELIRKLLSYLILGEVKYGYDEMQDNYQKLYLKDKDVYMKTVCGIINIIADDSKGFSIDDKEKMVLEHYLQVLKQEDSEQNFTEISNLEAQLNAVISVPEKDYSTTEIFSLPNRSLLPHRLEKAFSDQYEFDYFISYSNHDKSFVQSFLIPHLETKLNETDFPLKGCVHGRDFIPGVLILDNIARAIEKATRLSFY